jgi:hypothetical protein
LGTLGTRSMVNSTSAEVMGEPSENLTLGRSLKVQTLPSAVQDWARQGSGARSASTHTSGSNSVCESWMFGVSAWYCGSIDVGSVLSATTRSRAKTVPEKAEPATTKVASSLKAIGRRYGFPGMGGVLQRVRKKDVDEAWSRSCKNCTTSNRTCLPE